MDAYLYQEVLIDFFKRKPTEEEEMVSPKKKMDWLSFFAFLKNGSNLYLNLEVNNYDYKNENDPINRIIPLLTSGRNKTKFIANSELFSHFDKIKFHQDFENPTNLICFNNSVKDIKEKQSRNGYFIWTIKDYYNKWVQIKQIEDKNNKGITVGKSGFIKEWKDLSFLRHPCTDIIISEKFILKNEERALYSLQGILQNICLIENQLPRLLIISSVKDVFEKDVFKLFDKIQNHLENNKINVQLSIAIDQSNIIQHDRKIITNYFYLDSGDSWDYFNPKGGFKTDGTNIKALPLFGEIGINNMDQSLKEVRAVIDNKNTLIAGDPHSNLILNFLNKN